MTPSAPYVEYGTANYGMVQIHLEELHRLKASSTLAQMGVPVYYSRVGSRLYVWPEPGLGVKVIDPTNTPKQSLIDAISQARINFPDVFGAK